MKKYMGFFDLLFKQYAICILGMSLAYLIFYRGEGYYSFDINLELFACLFLGDLIAWNIEGWLRVESIFVESLIYLVCNYLFVLAGTYAFGWIQFEPIQLAFEGLIFILNTIIIVIYLRISLSRTAKEINKALKG